MHVKFFTFYKKRYVGKCAAVHILLTKINLSKVMKYSTSVQMGRTNCYTFNMNHNITTIQMGNFTANTDQNACCGTETTWGVGGRGAASIGDSAFAFLANIHRARAPSRCNLGLEKTFSISNSTSMPEHPRVGYINHIIHS